MPCPPFAQGSRDGDGPSSLLPSDAVTDGYRQRWSRSRRQRQTHSASEAPPMSGQHPSSLSLTLAAARTLRVGVARSTCTSSSASSASSASRASNTSSSASSVTNAAPRAAPQPSGRPSLSDGTGAGAPMGRWCSRTPLRPHRCWGPLVHLSLRTATATQTQTPTPTPTSTRTPTSPLTNSRSFLNTQRHPHTPCTSLPRSSPRFPFCERKPDPHPLNRLRGTQPAALCV